MNARWKHSSTCIYNIGYHIIWCPKYRKRIIVGNVEIRLKEILLDKAIAIGCTIDTMETMPDHIHLFIKAPPTIAIAKIVQMLKGYTAYMLRKEFYHLNRMKSLWARSYYCETVGHISQQTVTRYIQEQKQK